MLNKEKKNLKIYKKRIRKTNSNKKKLKKRYLKNLSIGRALQIINEHKRIEEEKDAKIKDINEKIEEISKMELTDYIKHINQDENGKEENSEDEEDTYRRIN